MLFLFKETKTIPLTQGQKNSHYLLVTAIQRDSLCPDKETIFPFLNNACGKQ